LEMPASVKPGKNFLKTEKNFLETEAHS
jgi:hypothetical protein